MAKLTQPKAAGFTKLIGANLLSRLDAVVKGLDGNTAYPNLPVDLATVKAAGASYAAALADALGYVEHRTFAVQLHRDRQGDHHGRGRRQRHQRQGDIHNAFEEQSHHARFAMMQRRDGENANRTALHCHG